MNLDEVKAKIEKFLADPKDYDVVVSYSMITKWRSCRQKFYYNYIDQIVPKKKSDPLEMGTMIHESLELKETDGDWKDYLKEKQKVYDELFIEERAHFGELINDAKRIVKGYEFRWKDEPLEFIQHEQEYIVPLLVLESENVTFKVGLLIKSDGLVTDGQDLWIIERKTHKKFPDMGLRVFDLQTSLYAWGLRKVGVKVKGVLWDEISSIPPTVPQKLKNGELTKRKNLRTDYYTYRLSIKKAKLDPKDYTDVLSRLKKEKDNTFYRRQRHPYRKQVVDNFVEHFKASVIDMLLNRFKPIMETGYQCRFCEYENLCYARVTGADTDFMIKADFKKKEKIDGRKEVKKK